MNKILASIQGYASCFGWVLQAAFNWLVEECPDLKFWKWHTNLDDHIWYAERVNGRVAMLALTTVLILELVSDRSIWDIIHVS
jgi:hypothetical protein